MSFGIISLILIAIIALIAIPVIAAVVGRSASDEDPNRTGSPEEDRGVNSDERS